MRPSLGDSPVQYINAPGYALFSPLQVMLATLLGTPLGGSLAMAWNYALLQRTAGAVIATSIGFLGTVGVCAAFALLKGPGVHLAALIVPVGVAAVAAYLLQGRPYRNHTERGGRTATFWRAAAVGGGCAAVLLGGYLALFQTPLGSKAFSFAGLRKPTPKINFSPEEEIYYEAGATEADARKLSEFLEKRQYFDGKSGATVRIARREESLVVSLVVRDGVWDRPSSVRHFSLMKEALRRDVFAGQAVELQLLDSKGELRKTID